MALRLAFSTLGCPDWSIEQVGQNARQYGYEGVELRFFEGELIKPDLPTDERARIKRALQGVAVCCLGTSARFSWSDPEERGKNRGDVERYLELANALESPFVRVFGGNVPEGDSLDDAVTRIADSLSQLAPAAERQGVAIVLETHDAMSAGRTVADVLARLQGSSVGALWDSHHPYRMGESVDETMDLLGERLLHTHVKDARRDGDKWQLVLLGEGEVPVREILAALHRRGWDGWVSVEWEKKWHPEIPAAEVAFPQHAEKLRAYLREIQRD